MPILGLVGDLISEGFGFFRERQQLKHQKKKQQIENQADWETRALETSGWKDEFWTIVLGGPLIVIFVGTLLNEPAMVQNMVDALKKMEDLPTWYQGAIGISIGASFGVKGYKVIQAAAEKKRKQR